MNEEDDAEYRRRREAEERDAAERSSCVIRDLHLALAEAYAAAPPPPGIGFTSGTVADILAEIASLASEDLAAASARAEHLRHDVLQAIAAGAEEPQEMARLALLSFRAVPSNAE